MILGSCLFYIFVGQDCLDESGPHPVINKFNLLHSNEKGLFPWGSNFNVLYDIYLPTEWSRGRGVPDEHSETDLLVYDFTDKGGTSMYVYFSK